MSRMSLSECIRHPLFVTATGLVFVFSLIMTPLLASGDDALAELQTLDRQGQLTVRALRAWNELPVPLTQLALDLHQQGIDLLGSDRAALTALIEEARRAGEGPLFDRLDDLQALVSHMAQFEVTETVTKAAIPLASPSLFTSTLAPSSHAQTVESPHGVKVTIPGNTLQHDETITIDSVIDAPASPSFAKRLNTYKITIGDHVYFKDPLWIEMAYDPEELQTDLAPLHALKVSYWDTQLEMWVESPVWVDETRHQVLFPTHHLTVWAIDVIGTNGHIYNDYFSMHYSLDELKKFETRYKDHRFDGSAYVQSVFNSLNDAKDIYEQAGFRELQKIRAVSQTYQHISSYAALHGVKPQTIENRHYNVYLTGSVLDTDASRSKYNGSITIPIDPFDGVNQFQIAHELFHSVQSRYYSMIGMTELGVPLTTAPSTTLLARQWWLEGTADYAAGKIAYPVNQKPNPLMGGVIEPRFLEKPLTHSPSALAFWRSADHHSYNNAWFFEYLVKHKGLPFQEMFTTVASYYNPSVYSNLSRYIVSKNMHINDVYTDFALWWFTGSDSPFGPDQIHRAISTTIETHSNPKTRMSFEFSDVLDELRVQTTADYRHTAKISRITANSGHEERPKPLIFVIPKELRTHRLSRTHEENNLLIFTVPSKTAVPPEVKTITDARPYQVHSVSERQPLFVLAVNNKGSAWYPKLDVHQVSFAASQKEVRGETEIEMRAENIPDVFAKEFVFKWYADGKEVFSDASPDVEENNHLLTVTSRYVMATPNNRVINVRLFSSDGELLGEDLVDSVHHGGMRYGGFDVSMDHLHKAGGWQPQILEKRDGWVVVRVDRPDHPDGLHCFIDLNWTTPNPADISFDLEITIRPYRADGTQWTVYGDSPVYPIEYGFNGGAEPSAAGGPLVRRRGASQPQRVPAFKPTRLPVTLEVSSLHESVSEFEGAKTSIRVVPQDICGGRDGGDRNHSFVIALVYTHEAVE